MCLVQLGGAASTPQHPSARRDAQEDQCRERFGLGLSATGGSDSVPGRWHSLALAEPGQQAARRWQPLSRGDDKSYQRKPIRRQRDNPCDNPASAALRIYR